jgi:Mg2+ and Co2+ transporter CorA
MNFEVLPETKWAHGYLFFWGLVATIAGFLYYLLKRIKLL